MANKQITLYTNKGSPYGQYVEIALLEANLTFTRFEVSFNPKPSWLLSLTHLGKVPVITYGGQPTAPDEPSMESLKLSESIAIIEFVNEIAPKAQLMGRDLVERAQVRCCIQFMLTSFAKAMYSCVVYKGPAGAVVKAFRQMQGFLPDEKDEGSFILGERFSLADAVIAAFVLRANTFFGNDLGSYPKGEGLKLFNRLQNEPEFGKYRAYVRTLKKRSTVVGTYSEVSYFPVIEFEECG
ncbi:hypothetical protein ONZ45_g9160 [Pleurotus djamor]|nr:hypothetical protein ONZ45_g9160 [Pleurotus djamor]